MSGSSLPATNRAAQNHSHLQSTPVRQTSVRSPNPAKKVTVTGDDDLYSAITAAAVRGHSKKLSASGEAGNAATAPSASSPPLSPTLMSSSSMAAIRADNRPTMSQRTASIDSTVSSISSMSQRPNGNAASRLSHEPIIPEDPAALIAAHGSAEAALHRVIADKQQAASHNAQLWRLVEKQRTMILGLNKDLERSLKEKERYRRKLKDHLAQSSSAPAMVGPGQRAAGSISREDSQSPSLSDHVADPVNKPLSSADISASLRKASDSSDVGSVTAGRSDTPQDLANLSSSSSSTKPLSANSLATIARDEQSNASLSSAAAAGSSRGVPGTPPFSGNSASDRAVDTQTSPANARTRKAPPAPLNLGPKPEIDVSRVADPSDSEYEDEPESARSDYIERGRRKTREDDDREREAQVQQEDEQRSRSTKNQQVATKPVIEKGAASSAEDQRKQTSAYQATADPTEILRTRAVADSANVQQRNAAPASLLSPGLPMSPRPGDRPMNSPMPRAPVTPSAMPMSPKSGLPLSPRPPTKPIPLPPQTPLGITSPHLDRAKGYNVQGQQPPPTPSERLKATDSPEPADLRPSISSEGSRGEVYRGLATEQYPDLLLPPNALPSIFIKTASSRMKPSRASMVSSKNLEELPVFTLGVHERSEKKQLWRIEKSYGSLINLDAQINATTSTRGKVTVPDKALFQGHAPVKIDARRVALNKYFDRLLDCVLDDRAAIAVCKFMSTDAIGAEKGSMYGSSSDARPETPQFKTRAGRAGYLTKRGKNFGGWKARYFVLDGPNLKYFEGPGGAHLGSIKLQNAQIGSQTANDSQQDEDNQFRHAFMILEPKKKDSSSIVRHVLCAESDAERDGWVDALLQYVDYKDGDDEKYARQGVSKADYNAPKSPRSQKSAGDVKSSASNARDLPSANSIGMNYSETVAGDAPVMGSPTIGAPSSPPLDRVPSHTPSEHSQSGHLTISGPKNPQVIGNDWGMKPPPTPNSKDKKRSVFSSLPFSRGRSSSELTGNDKVLSPSYPPSSQGARAVFGVPLAEAVEIARPAHVTVDMPAVVYRCIEYLTANNAISEEGIFRLSGSNTVIRALKDRFNNEGDVNLLAEEEEYYDIHAIASLLKLYLRELPSSILTRELHLDFLQCLEIPGDDKVIELNALVHQLPGPNRAVLEALSELLLMVVENVAVNKMNVRNLGVVFAPTLNLPGPLITLFVEDQPRVFGPLLSDAERPASHSTTSASTDPSASAELRSPRKQMFSADLPTPAYHQTAFPLPPGAAPVDDHTGMIPIRPSYAAYQMAPQGEGGFGSLNDALRSPTVIGTGVPTPRGGGAEKKKRRESGSGLSGLGMGGGGGSQRKSSGR